MLKNIFAYGITNYKIEVAKKLTNHTVGKGVTLPVFLYEKINFLSNLNEKNIPQKIKL